MTKSDLAAELEKLANLSGPHAQRVVDAIFESMTESLNRDENVYVRGFGSMVVRRYQPYMARNPKTGEAAPVKGRRRPMFIVSKEILNRLNPGDAKPKDDTNP